MLRIVDHGTWQLAAADEELHPPGPQLLWNESYYFDFAAPDGSVGGYVRLGLYPNWNRAWYWACIVRPGRPLVLLADNAVPLPEPGSTTVRTPAITAGQQITQPLLAAKVSLQAMAFVLPEPVAAYGGLSTAAPVQLAMDLDWITEGGVYPYKDLPRYEIPCRVTGSVRVGDDEIAVSGWGERDHSWGERDWWQISWLWSSGRLADGTAFHGMQANIGFAIGWPSFAVPPGGEVSHLTGFCAQTDFGPDDFPQQSRLRLPGAPMTAVPVAFAPVAMTSPDGRLSRFPRALCEFTADDGRTGYGWTEWNQPPGWRDHGWSYLSESDGEVVR
ncbi:MAG TPA: hypothetical protein VMA32_07065 [Streptosporangiaceae bacterium]|nr:hypothetical protein [Streptosporangiaceae bacterium]